MVEGNSDTPEGAVDFQAQGDLGSEREIEVPEARGSSMDSPVPVGEGTDDATATQSGSDSRWPTTPRTEFYKVNTPPQMRDVLTPLMPDLLSSRRDSSNFLSGEGVKFEGLLNPEVAKEYFDQLAKDLITAANSPKSHEDMALAGLAVLSPKNKDKDRKAVPSGLIEAMFTSFINKGLLSPEQADEVRVRYQELTEGSKLTKDSE